MISRAVDRSTDSDDDQAHLRQIMLDAGENISKYQLWLNTWATEQVKWSDTNRVTPTMDNQVLPPILVRNLKQKLSELHSLDAGTDGL